MMQCISVLVDGVEYRVSFVDPQYASIYEVGPHGNNVWRAYTCSNDLKQTLYLTSGNLPAPVFFAIHARLKEFAEIEAIHWNAPMGSAHDTPHLTPEWVLDRVQEIKDTGSRETDALHLARIVLHWVGNRMAEDPALCCFNTMGVMP